MPNLTEKLRAVSEHHKLTHTSASSKEMHKAVRKKFGDKSVDTLYSDLPYAFRTEFEKKLPAKPAVPLAVVDGKSEQPKVVEGEVIPPGQPVNLKVDGASQHTAVAAPNYNFNLTPSSVQINPGNVSWAYTLQRSVMYAFVFFSGSMFGVLTTLALLRKVS